MSGSRGEIPDINRLQGETLRAICANLLLASSLGRRQAHEILTVQMGLPTAGSPPRVCAPGRRGNNRSLTGPTNALPDVQDIFLCQTTSTLAKQRSMSACRPPLSNDSASRGAVPSTSSRCLIASSIQRVILTRGWLVDAALRHQKRPNRRLHGVPRLHAEDAPGR